MRPENEHDMVLWKHISRGGGKPPPSGSCSTVITRRFAGSRPTGSATAPLPKRSYWTPLRISGSMPGNSASRLPSGPICSAPCATARSTGFATNAPTASPSRDLSRLHEPGSIAARSRRNDDAGRRSRLATAHRCREVFRKSREEGLSNAAIADQMRISVKTVEAQITKALRRIREKRCCARDLQPRLSGHPAQ